MDPLTLFKKYISKSKPNYDDTKNSIKVSYKQNKEMLEGSLQLVHYHYNHYPERSDKQFQMNTTMIIITHDSILVNL